MLLRRIWTLLLVLTLALSFVPPPVIANDNTLALPAVDDDYALDLGGVRFDPLYGAPALPPAWRAPATAGPDLHLVQLVGPTQALWLAALEKAGLEVVQYIHPFTYVVWGDAAALRRAEMRDFVRWTGPFAPAYRVLPEWRALDATPLAVYMMVYRSAGRAAVTDALAALGAQLEAPLYLGYGFDGLTATLPGNRLVDAARIPGVYTIQPTATERATRGEMSNQVNVNNVDANNQAFTGYRAWLTGVGLDGSGVVIANVDSGIQDTHPDLVNRMRPCAGTTCGGATSSAHGTHTAGIMAADGSAGVLDSRGFLRGLGVAPGASLVEQVYGSYDLTLLMRDSVVNGAVISGNSWGPGSTPRGYDADTRKVDVGVRDANLTVPGNQPLHYILSIMNGYGGVSTQGTPDEAKNIFTIGSTKMQNSNGSQILAINDLSNNTAHGPALDGRKIPHMVAPGCYVDSTVPTNAYGTMCGTSMASPHVSGAAALFIEYYRGLFGVDPSPALLKAAFLPVAHSLVGNRDANNGILGHPFDSKQGWGRMDLAAVVNPALPVLYFDNPQLFDNSGEMWEQPLAAADPTQPVRLMLVWTDAPGHGLGGSTPAWVNNLDLVVEADGDTYRGNAFAANGWSQPNGAADGMNNTEGVFLGPAAPATFTVRVLATNIAGDGVPNVGDGTDQDFALVCYNCMIGADFTLDVDSLSMALCAPDVVSATVTVGQQLGYAEAVTLAVQPPVGITATVSPTVVAPPGAATLTLSVGPEITAGVYTVTLTATAELTNVKAVQLALQVNTCAPESPVLLSPADGAAGQPYTGLSLAWEAQPLSAGYRVQVDRTPLFASPLVDALASTAAYSASMALESDACYWWRAQANNACGSGAWAEPFHFATVGVDVVFGDDMESGAANWEQQTPVGAATWTLTTAQSYSPEHAWYVPDAPETTDSRLWNALPVPVGAGSTLRFWHRYAFEGSGDFAWDGAVLEISTDDGATWEDLAPHFTSNGYNGVIRAGTSNPLAGRSGWVGELAVWTEVAVDLSAFAGESVQIRWRIGCDGSVGALGWFIDDVVIAAPAPPNPPPTLDAVLPAAVVGDTDTLLTLTGAGFVGLPAVRLGATWLPTVTLVSSATVTAMLPAGMANGVYTLTLFNGDCQPVALANVLTIQGSLAAPERLSPLPGALITVTTPLLAWESVPQAVGYRVRLNDTLHDVGNTLVYTTPVLADGVYTWTVTAYNVWGGVSPAPAPWTFTIETPRTWFIYLPLLLRGE